MKKRIIGCISVILLVLLPFASLIAIGENIDDPYEGAFTAALCDKYDTLAAGEGGRIIFIGGSSLPFGLRCDLLEEHLGIKVYDFGVYAALGTKAMCELALPLIKEGDIVILAPELSAQTYSLYFNSGCMWQSICGRWELIKAFSSDEKALMIKNYLPFLIEKIRVAGTNPSYDGSVYSRSAFNEYGDISVDRPANIMAGGYDSSCIISLDGLINEDFIAYVNGFAADVSAKGATVYFTFSPTNQAAAGFTGAESDSFADRLEEQLDCGILGSPSEMTYASDYFYNTNYHLNSTGAILHSRTLCRLLAKKLGIEDAGDIEVPDIGGDTGSEELPEYDENEKYFEFEKIGSVWYLKSVKEEYRAAVTELTLPAVYGGEAVKGIEGGCFKGCTGLEKITIPDGYCIFDSGIFEGCGSLDEIYIGFTSPGYTSVPQNGLFDGASSRLKVYIKTSAWGRFVSDYSWRFYSDYFVKY